MSGGRRGIKAAGGKEIWGQDSVTLYPKSPDSKYEEYREAWHLLDSRCWRGAGPHRRHSGMRGRILFSLGRVSGAVSAVPFLRRCFPYSV